MIKIFGGRVRLALAVLGSGLFCIGANAAIQVLGVQYQADELFPEYNCIWHDKNYPTSCSFTYMGANVHVYFKNTGGTSISMSDITLAGYSLPVVIKTRSDKHNAASIYYYWDNPPADIIAAGLPMWYKMDPPLVPAGGVGQAVIRLKFPPTTPTVTVGLTTTGGSASTNITVDANTPQLANVGFSWDRAKVFLHWRRNSGGAPLTILMDGVDVTAQTVTVGDPSMNFAESVITPPAPLTYMSYHVFQGIYADGKIASASLRTWSHPFIHASWGVFPDADLDEAHSQQWVEEATAHSFNAAQNQFGGIGGFVDSPSGKAFCDARGGYGVIVWNNISTANPLLSFIDDEVDAEESNLGCGSGFDIPCGASPMGILGMDSIAVGQTYRQQNPNTPTTINMDAALKPENYYAYGQLADVLQADPYYQKRLKDTYWYHNPEWIPLYKKATYIYAVSKACTRAAEPNSFHVILNSTESTENVNGVVKTWPFASPECKRIEAYYALAAGSKGISYWWFNTCGGECSNGLGDQGEPSAQALWKEMGMYGNEIKTVSELIVTSHPVDVPITPGTNVWARALAVGPDTMILLVVNDNYYNDEAGFHSTDVPNATVNVTLPLWLQTPLTAFDVSVGGIRPVNMQMMTNQLQINLGTLQITRMIVLTKDSTLLPKIQQRYDEQVRPRVCTFAPQVCTNVPLAIVQHPTNQVAVSGGNGSFNVVAFGTNLRYQWQTNNVDLANGPHYSGCTNAALAIQNCGDNDATIYRCVVTSATGISNSTYATLTITTNPPSTPTATAATGVTGTGFIANWNNPSGASGYRLDVSTNNSFSSYLPGYQDLDTGNTLSWNVNGLVLGRTYYYRVRAYNTFGTSDNSGTISVTTVLSAPFAPVVNGASGVTTNEFLASWNLVAGATGYRLDVSTNGAFSNYLAGYQNLDVGDTSSRTVSGLTAGKTYYYRVRATNEAGPSPNSGIVGVTTLPLPPTVLPATSIISSSFKANWNGVTGVSGYLLDVSTTNTFDTFVPGWQSLDVGNVSNRVVLELKGNTSYYYRVRSYNITGPSGNSGNMFVTLPASTSNACVVISNPDFEGGFGLAGGGTIANGWTEWEGFVTATVGFDETVIVHGGSHSQRLRITGTTTNVSAGGAYQRLPVTSGLPYSVSVWTYAGDSLATCYLGVDPAGGTNGNSSNVAWSVGNNTQSWVRKTWTGVATANYITVFLKVTTADDVKRNGYFDDLSPMPGAPRLSAQGNASGLILTWPDCPSMRLERAASLTSPLNWSTVTNQPTGVGGEKSVNLSPSESAGFFRLVVQ